jgi:hypothetical protein
MEESAQRNRTLLLTLLLRAVNAVGQIAISLFLLKAYGQAAVGYFAVLISNTMLAALLTRQGFDRTLTLFALRPKASLHTHSLFRSYVRSIILCTPLSGLLNVLVYYATIRQSPSTLMALVVLLLPTVVAISSLAAGYFTGFGKTVAASIQQPGFSFAIASFVLAVSFPLGIKLNVFAAYFLVASAVSFVGLYRILRDTGDNLTVLLKAPRQLKTSIRRLALRYSRQYLVINFFTTFSSVYFISFLALFVASDAIGQFKVVERLAMVIAFNLTFVNIILPARAISQRLANDHVPFDRSIQLTFLFQYATGLGVFLIYLVFMNQITEWIEVDNMLLYVLLLTAQLINALTGPVRVILMYLSGQRVLQGSAILETFGSAFLYWILYRAYGLTGLAIGYFLAISIPNIVLACIVYKRFGIIPIPFIADRPPINRTD